MQRNSAVYVPSEFAYLVTVGTQKKSGRLIFDPVIALGCRFEGGR